MVKWEFNLNLLLGLSGVLDISFAEIARRSGIKQQMLSRYIQQDFVVSVGTLIKICNALRMPFYYFVTENGVSVIPERENATVPRDDWHSIRWDGQAAESVFYKNHISWADVSKAMGIKSQNARKRFLEGTRFPVDEFFDTCSKLQVSPYNFIIDRNRPEEKRRRGANRKEKQDVPQGFRERMESAPADDIATLRREIEELRATIGTIQGQYNTLRQDFGVLRKEYNALAYRVSVNIDTINNSHLSIAAEPDTDFEKKSTRKNKQEAD
ncbi:MAG: helix-turn-helix domain-containing protein [Bacteroidaceae bacterium]|nr:helix-turn-helix domain-containing protein [Bacteroidaceae bacterium]